MSSSGPEVDKTATRSVETSIDKYSESSSPKSIVDGVLPSQITKLDSKRFEETHKLNTFAHGNGVVEDRVRVWKETPIFRGHYVPPRPACQTLMKNKIDFDRLSSKSQVDINELRNYKAGTGKFNLRGSDRLLNPEAKEFVPIPKSQIHDRIKAKQSPNYHIKVSNRLNYREKYCEFDDYTSERFQGLHFDPFSKPKIDQDQKITHQDKLRMVEHHAKNMKWHFQP